MLRIFCAGMNLLGLWVLLWRDGYWGLRGLELACGRSGVVVVWGADALVRSGRERGSAASLGGSAATALANLLPPIWRKAASVCVNTASAEPNAASSLRAVSLPTPGVRLKRSQAVSSARSKVRI